MPPILKATIGFLATLAAAWIWHGPLGHGEALVDRLEGEARAAVARSWLTGISVSLGHDPLDRNATLSGKANDIQREGLGSGPGISDYVREVEGLASVRWADEPSLERRALPLLAETMILTALAYLIGLGLGALLWGRRRREGFD
ncbi:MAG TPA: hypothetical protein VF718_05235 [Allosphingosinicella sp.]|jgi:hypothetical protein